MFCRKACRERGALVAVGESLVREIARLRQDLETRSAAIMELQETTRNEADRNCSSEVSSIYYEISCCFLY